MERPRVREGGRQAAGRRALIAESAGSGTPYPSEGRSAGSDVRASGDPRLHALEGESVYPRSCREESIAEAVLDVAACGPRGGLTKNRKTSAGQTSPRTLGAERLA